MKKIIIASNNAHKIKEIKEILNNPQLEIKSLKEEKIFIEVIEDGMTFEENAKKKCTEIANYLKDKDQNNFVVIADDSGLEVEHLNGAPGIYSARYAGEPCNDYNNNTKLLNELSGIKYNDRKARFVCQISIIDDKGLYNTVRGEVEGIILDQLDGTEGFGYDPLFYYEPYKKTFAQMTLEQKNNVSHRGMALQKLKNIINLYLD